MVKKILAIDGGGMYGVIPTEVCLKIEQELKKPLRDIFDLFVGTSTGSLICSAALRGILKEDIKGIKDVRDLAKLKPLPGTTFGLSAQQIMDIYINTGKYIFGPNSKSHLDIKVPILNEGIYPDYDPQGLRAVINFVLGDGSLTRIEKAEKLIVTAYDLTNRKPRLFTSWGADKNVELNDIVMASSSVPKTHPVFEINGTFYTDGGVFASNPALIAYSEAKAKFPDDDLVIVSLGTGIPIVKIPTPKPDDDILWWLKNIFKIFLDGQEESVDNALKQIASQPSNKLNYFRFDCEVANKKGAEIDEKVLEEARKNMRNKMTTESTKVNQMIAALK